ncbi:MAG: hypothetical protein ACYTHM_11310, partial [Planctomycetota bacterium]
LPMSKAHCVLAGTLHVPVEAIQKAVSTGRHAYVQVKVEISEILKGTVEGKELTFQYYTRKAPYSPAPKMVADHNGEKAIAFLVRAGPKNKWYLIHTPSALVTHTQTAASEIKTEAATHKKILEAPEKYLEVEKDETFETVKSLIEDTQNKEKAGEAYKRLIALGKKGVPAMVHLMDDRRDLAVKGITLKNRPGHWEAVRHYGPKKVVDVLDAILNHIMGFGGSITNGGNREEEEKGGGGREKREMSLYGNGKSL